MGLRAIYVRNLEQDLIPIAATQQTATVGNTAAACPAIKSNLCSHVLITVVTDAIRVTFDGSTPTSSAGHLIAAGASETWSRAKHAAAKTIRVTNDAQLTQTEFMT
jgi:hypothetical protein